MKKILIVVVLIAFCQEVTAQVSVGVDLMSRKEFLKYNDPGNRIIPDPLSSFSFGALVNVGLGRDMFVETGIYSWTYTNNIELYGPNYSIPFLSSVKSPNRFATIPVRFGYRFALDSDWKFLRKLSFSPILGTALTMNGKDRWSKAESGNYQQSMEVNKSWNLYLEGGIRAYYPLFHNFDLMFNYSFVKGFRDFSFREVEYEDFNNEANFSTVISDGSARHWSFGLIYKIKN
ncbi:hypothetical protein [Litoribacter populi]|uniref:hypothetical protein n=1 Tax=Litoribacter populi TaxID=2598460 RepID=UPI00117DE99F|nr:hypothetical protein [Litoribacter populi]